MDAIVSPTSVRYIILGDKKKNYKYNKRKRIQEGDILRILRKST